MRMNRITAALLAAGLGLSLSLLLPLAAEGKKPIDDKDVPGKPLPEDPVPPDASKPKETEDLPEGGAVPDKDAPATGGDRAFDRYVDLVTAAEALQGLHTPALVDAAIGLAEAERLYHRKHLSGVTADSLFRSALRVARDKHDKTSLERLAKAAETLQKKDWADEVDRVVKVGAPARALKPLADGVPAETRAFYENFPQLVLAAELAHDMETLTALTESIAFQKGLTAEQQADLKKLVAAATERAKASEDDPTALLKGPSRGTSKWDVLRLGSEAILQKAVSRALGGVKVPFSENWGNTASVWKGQTKVVWEGIHTRVERINETANDGLWKQGWAQLDGSSFVLKLTNYRRNALLDMSVDFTVSGNIRAYISGRQYTSGVQLWAADGEGRATVTLRGNFRAKVNSAHNYVNWNVTATDLSYSNLVVDRVGLVGGYGARLFGDAMNAAINQWFSQQKRNALTNAQNSISGAFNGSVPIRRELIDFVVQYAPK